VTSRTRTREVVEAQTVEEEEHYCPHCEQWYLPEHIAGVGLGLNKKSEPETTDQLCETCMENIFGYDPSPSRAEVVKEEMSHWTWREFVSLGTVGLLGIGLLTLLVNGVGWALQSAATLAANTDTVTEMLVATIQPPLELMVIFMVMDLLLSMLLGFFTNGGGSTRR